jgi:hypothetical protein
MASIPSVTSMEDIEARFVTWAQGEDAMRAAFVCASRTHSENEAVMLAPGRGL